MMPKTNISKDERKDFSERMIFCLMEAGIKGGSPTQVQRAFNRNYGGDPITVHAARKWVVGEAIPTQDKLRVLAQIARTSPEYLRFGTGDTKVKETAESLPADELWFLASVRKLTNNQKDMLAEFLQMLSRQKG